jgi:hypothetical protein
MEMRLSGTATERKKFRQYLINNDYGSNSLWKRASDITKRVGNKA